jgi:hypothetical protein
MVRLLGGNPVVGICIAICLLTVGVLGGDPLILIAAGVVGVASVFRLLVPSARDGG